MYLAMKNLILMLFVASTFSVQSQSLIFDADSAEVDISIFADPPMFMVDFPIGYTMFGDPVDLTSTNYKFIDVTVPPGSNVSEVEFNIGLSPGIYYSPGNLTGTIMNMDLEEDFISGFFNSFILAPNSIGGTASFTIEFSDELNVPFDTITLTVNVCLQDVQLDLISYTPPVPFCPDTEIEFIAPLGFETYAWTGGSTTPAANIVVGIDGFVSLDVTDENGCVGMDMIVIDFDEPVEQPLCFVTVDPDTGKNRLLWEKSAGQGIDSFNIYKQGVAVNQYDLIGSQHFDEFSEFIDFDSNPLSQSERYRITAKNGCGTEGQALTSHKTVHLTSNVGINNEVNLIWEPYEGLQYATFNIYRGADANSLSLIAQRPSNTFTYTDFDAPTGTLIYQIEIEAPAACDPSRAESSIRSNIAEANTVGINELAKSGFNLFPNPTTDYLEIRNIPTVGLIKISDNLGRSLKQFDATKDQNRNLNIADLTQGVYLISIEGISGAIKFIKL